MFFLVILLLSTAVLFLSLGQSPFLKGTDAYYYALQVDTWARTGHVRIPDASWIFPCLGAIQRIGLTTETVLKGFTAGGVFLMALFFWLANREAPTVRRTAAAIGIFLSPTLLFTAVEFPKMFLAMAFLPLWECSADRRRMLISAVAMALAFWAHRSALVFLGGFAAGYWLDRRLKKPESVGIVLLAFTGLATLMFFLVDRSPAAEIQRLLPSLRLSLPGLFSLVSRDSLPIALKAELVFFAAVFVFYFLQKAFRPESGVPFRYLVPGLFSLMPFGSRFREVLSLGARLAWFLPLFTLLVWVRSGESETGSAKKNALILGVLMGLGGALSAPLRLGLSHPSALDPDYPQIHQITRSLSQIEVPMLIAHKNMAYYYKYALGREAFPYEPEDHWDKSRIRRLIYGIRPDELWPYLTLECRGWAPEGKDYLLLGEDCWHKARKRIDPEQDSDLYNRAWNPIWNPSKKRPAFLYPKHEDDQPDEFPALPPKGGR